MFKNNVLKKLSIGLASLALIGPLALGASQVHTHASSVKYVRPFARTHGVSDIHPINSSDKNYNNYLTGKNALWSKPAFEKGAKMITTRYGSYQLAKAQVPFKVLSESRKSNYYLLKSLKPNYVGWINANTGVYTDSVSARRTRLSVVSKGVNKNRSHKTRTVRRHVTKNRKVNKKLSKRANSDNVFDHSMKPVNMKRVPSAKNYHFWNHYRLSTVVPNQGINAKLWIKAQPVKSVHLKHNTKVYATMSSKGFILKNSHLAAPKGGYWAYAVK